MLLLVPEVAVLSTPSFQFYPKQWLGDNRVLSMDWDARAVHFHLLCIAWQEAVPCSIPANDEIIQRFLGEKKTWKRVKTQVLSAWRLEGDRYFQDGLLRVLATQEKRRENGAKGGRPRGKSDNDAPAEVSEKENLTETTGLAPSFLPLETKPKAKRKPRGRASSSSSSTTVSKRIGGAKAPPHPFPDDLEGDAVDFLAMCEAAMSRGTSEAGEQTRRSEIASMVDRFGLEAARYGLREATRREKNSVGYALACAKSFSTRQARDGDREELADDGAGPDSFPLLEDLIAQGVVK
jgi:uncharacterized protein YdaU (DUF1376 family)